MERAMINCSMIHCPFETFYRPSAHLMLPYSFVLETPDSPGEGGFHNSARISDSMISVNGVLMKTQV